MPTQCLSDLTDREWRWIQPVLPSDGADTAVVRRTINLLRFRSRAQLPWVLVEAAPHDLNRARKWHAEGKWKTIEERLGLLEPESDPIPQTIRRKLARAMHRVPGGPILLAPVRPIIRAVEHLNSRSTPAAKLPGIYLRARRLLDAGELEDAALLFRHILKVDPINSDSRLRLAGILSELGEEAESREHLRVVLSAPELNREERIRIHGMLAVAYVRTHEAERAVGHAFLSRLLDRDKDEAVWDRDTLAIEADDFELLSETINDYAEFAIIFRCDFKAAETIYALQPKMKQDYATWLARIPETLFLPLDWVRNIGHVALLDYWLKMQRMGLLDRKRIVLHAPPERISNRAYLNCYAKHIHLAATPATGATRHLTASLGPRVAATLSLPGHPDRYLMEAVGVIQEMWEGQNRPPVLELTEEDREFGRQTLAELGLPDGAWFVSLHVRTPGYYGELTKGGFQDHRNADIETYESLIAAIVARGGWVVRLGDSSMPPLPPYPGTIDYACSDERSDRMDVYLCAACRFFVGVTSGLSHLPLTFGVPTLFTNWIATSLPPYSRNDLYVLKPIWSAPKLRLLTFEELFAFKMRTQLCTAVAMREIRVEPIDNTPEELREAAVEMMDRLDGRYVARESDLKLQERFTATARKQGLDGFATISAAFLRKYRELLAPVEARKAG